MRKIIEGLKAAIRYAKADKADARTTVRQSGLRKCRGCGAIYHKSWGGHCPDCTGAT
jgi:hypothetical protein